MSGQVKPGQNCGEEHRPTLAERLGITAQESPLLQKAKRLGLATTQELESLAVARGCWHYRNPETSPAPNITEAQFGNEELAIALLSPSQPYSPYTIRLGAAMLGADGNSPDLIARLTRTERSEAAVRHVARAGRQFEPENPFWRELIEKLPDVPAPEEGVFPHPTRFVSMTGFTRSGPGRVIVWIRPRTALATVHG